MSASPPPASPAAMLGCLLPPDVVWRLARIEDLAAPLHPLEAPAVARAVPRRQREFAAGRHCAREALRVLCGEAAPVTAAADRAPNWPNGVVGSITHSDSHCAAAVARAGAMAGLGIDIDSVARFDPSLETAICTPDEIERWLADQDLERRQQRLALIFSVKEAFYKAQYAVSRAWLGFEDVEVRRFDARAAGVLALELEVLRPPRPRPGNALQPEVVHWLTSRRWTGHAALDGQNVLASVVLRR